MGCGKVGRALTEQLDEPGNNITVIDINGARATEVAERFDVMHVAGNGATRAVLEEAGIDKAELLIAVTGSDERNLLCCLIAKKPADARRLHVSAVRSTARTFVI